MTNDNKPMQADPALFETMSRLTASAIHAERMDAERNAPTSPNSQ